ITAMVKHDLTADELASMEKILDVFQADFIELRTSHLAKEELDRIPEPYRPDHVRLFRLIKLAGEADETPRMPEDPRLQTVAVQLKGTLSESDFNHLMQASNAKAEFLLTGDGGVLRQVLASELGIAVLSPRELESELRRRHLIAPA